MGVLDRMHRSNNLLDMVAELKRRLADLERFMAGGGTSLPYIPSVPGGLVPMGGIILWSGIATGRPEWALCDGTRGTPDLRWHFPQTALVIFPALPMVDTFLRDNIGPPPSDAWSVDGTEADSLVVDTQQCAGESAGRNVAWRNEPYGFMTWISARIAVLPADGETVRIYAGFSVQDAGSGDGYMIEWTYHAGTDDDVDLYRIDAGAPTLLNSGTGFNVAVGGSIGLAMAPSLLFAFVKENGAAAWDEIQGDADDTYAQIGFVGLDLEGTTVRVDELGILSVAHLMRVV